jgi:Spy/CpxP family protein refolding chaperone
MTTTMRRLGLGFCTHVLAVGLGAGIYAAGQDQLQGRFDRPLMAQAQRGGPGRSGSFGGPGSAMGPMGLLGLPPMIADQLNLSDAQRDQIRSAVDSRRDEVRMLVERATPARQALDAAAMSQTFDEATIRARSAELATIDADMAVTRARIFTEVVKVLTPDQRKQLDALRAQMEQRRQQQIERRANRSR